MEELNTLISPYKKLKVGPPEDTDTVCEGSKPFEQSQQHQVTESEKGTVNLKEQRVDRQENDFGVVMEIDNDMENMNSDMVMKVRDMCNMRANYDGYISDKQEEMYVDIATAMLVNKDEANDFTSTEKISSVKKDSETDLKQNCENMNPHMLLISNNQQESESTNCESKENLVPEETELDASLDLAQSIDIVNACRDEIENLIEVRKTEVVAICSAVNVGALVREMEDRFRQKGSSECESLSDEIQKPEASSDLDESHSSECTDDLNSSTKTVVDTTGLEINQLVHMSDGGPNSCVNDDLVLKDCFENTVSENYVDESEHYQHVYANVVIEKLNNSGGKFQLSEQGFSTLMEQTCGFESSSDEENERIEIFPDGAVTNCTLRRIDGDGKENDENVGNYFCAVEADDNERIELGQYHNVPIEQKAECCETDLTEIERDNTGLVSLTHSRMAYPLCASTPLPYTGCNVTEMTQIEQRDDVNLQGMNEDGSLGYKERNSEPLCASTPISKSTQGLRVRDMNIMPDRDSKKQVKFSEKIQDGKAILRSDFVNEDCFPRDENDMIAIHNDKNVKLERRAIEGKFQRDRESKREKKNMKGVRKEKFKEYMGPGLTSAPDEAEVMTDSSQKNMMKNSDVETCTLTEYKGFGLTGPPPSKAMQTSTPLAPLAEESNKVDQNDAAVRGTLRRCISGTSLGGRPAGTEGMLIDELVSNKAETNTEVNSTPFNFGTEQRLRKTVSESKFGQKVKTGVTELNTRTLTRHTSDLGPQGYTRQNRLTGWLASVQEHKTPLPTLSENSQPATSAMLKPDQAYPSVTSITGDKSESNSNTDKSDKSEKVAIDPKLLQNAGQLKISAYMNFGLLTVHVIQGRQLSTKWKSTCDSFVKLSLLPDDGKKPKCKTEVVQDTNNPLYDEKFSFELNEEDHSKRLMISVWHRDTTAGVNEFLGCMSFGIRHLTNPKKEVNSWYYLLTEDVGRKKHLQVSHRQHPQLRVRNQSQIPSVNKDVWGTESLTLTLHRGKTGFGFSVIEACPVRVGRVDGTSPAEAAGLQQGDIIIRLNRQNVSRSTATSVAKLIKHSSNTMVLELHRPKPITYEQLENSPLKPSLNHGTNTNHMTINDYQDQSVPHMYTLNDDDENKENEDSLEDQTLYPINPHLASLATSTPLPLLARGHRTVQTCEVRKQEAIHRLLTLELDFIDLMHAGMQRYSRPLRHCILSHSHHSTLFQNIEKLVTISEYHVKQMHDNAPSSFVSEDDTDTSGSSDNHNFIQSIGLIYQSKVHMLCQAYDLYAKGISAANQLLSELRRNEDFVRFVRDPPLQGNQPSISTFIYRPVQHIRELYKVLQDVFSNTSTDSSDYNSLKEIVEGLQECSTNITNYSCDRVESLTSLTSRDSKTSFTCSMKSKSSSTSCSSASSKGQGHLLQTSKAVDQEVMKIQDRLVFPSNVPVFQLCQDDRHLIFSGDMFKWDGRQWMKIHVYLFTDLILETVRESDGYLRVIQEPTMLRDVAAMDAQRQHATEFVLYCSARLHESRRSGKRKLNFRAPSTEQKMAWKSLIEQRVFVVRGSMDYYSSTSDVSSSSASAIVI